MFSTVSESLEVSRRSDSAVLVIEDTFRDVSSNFMNFKKKCADPWTVELETVRITAGWSQNSRGMERLPNEHRKKQERSSTVKENSRQSTVRLDPEGHATSAKNGS